MLESVIARIPENVAVDTLDTNKPIGKRQDSNKLDKLTDQVAEYLETRKRQRDDDEIEVISNRIIAISKVISTIKADIECADKDDDVDTMKRTLQHYKSMRTELMLKAQVHI